MLCTIQGLGASVCALGHVSLKLALPLSDAVYDLGLGLFGSSLRPCELGELVLFLIDAVYDLGFGRFGVGLEAMGA